MRQGSSASRCRTASRARAQKGRPTGPHSRWERSRSTLERAPTLLGMSTSRASGALLAMTEKGVIARSRAQPGDVAIPSRSDTATENGAPTGTVLRRDACGQPVRRAHRVAAAQAAAMGATLPKARSIDAYARSFGYTTTSGDRSLNLGETPTWGRCFSRPGHPLLAASGTAGAGRRSPGLRMPGFEGGRRPSTGRPRSNNAKMLSLARSNQKRPPREGWPKCLKKWCARRDSNARPSDPESDALSG